MDLLICSRTSGGILVYLPEVLPGADGAKFTVCTIVGMVLSFVFLSQATKVLPLGTSYAIWTGIGAWRGGGGVVIFHESLSPARLLFAALLLVGIIGLKATSGH